MAHKTIISELGGASAVADFVSRAAGKPIHRDTVYKWQSNGVPWRWRPFVARMAKQKDKRLPKDFMPGAAA